MTLRFHLNYIIHWPHMDFRAVPGGHCKCIKADSLSDFQIKTAAMTKHFVIKLLELCQMRITQRHFVIKEQNEKIYTCILPITKIKTRKHCEKNLGSVEASLGDQKLKIRSL